MPALVRYSISIGLAFIVSAALLFAMSKLIITERGIADRIEKLFFIEFVDLESDGDDLPKRKILPARRPELPPL